MRLFDLLQEVQQDVNYGERYFFYYDSLAINAELQQMQEYYPELASSLKNRLAEIYAQADVKDDAAITAELVALIRDYSRQVSYLPIAAVQTHLYLVEKEIGKTQPDQSKLINGLEDAATVLATSERNYWLPLG
jgi:hypothetical protein